MCDYRAGMSADYQIEVSMLENKPIVSRAQTERVVGNQHNRLLR